MGTPKYIAVTCYKRPITRRKTTGYNQARCLMMFHVSLAKAEDGWIVAEVPALPGCVSQGRDEKEALENVKEAIAAWLWAEDQKAVSNSRTGGDQILVSV